GENRSAVAKAAQRLGGKKARRGDEAEGAETAALVACAERLGRVVEHKNAFSFRDRTDGVMVGALPEKVDRNNRPRREAELFRGRDAALQRIYVHVECPFIDIDEPRRRPGQRPRRTG